MTTTTKTTRNLFPLLTASTTDAEMLRYLANPEMAIGFALEHLEDFELRAFLKDWKDGADMVPWLEGWRIDQRAGMGDWSGHDRNSAE